MASTYNQDVARSFRTITEMLRDRGVVSTHLERLTGDDVIAAAGGKLLFHIDDSTSGYRIIYDMSPKFKLGNIRKLLDPANEQVKVYLVVVRDKQTVTPAAQKSVKELGGTGGFDVEFFDVKRLQYNLSKHSLVPKHEPVRDEKEIQDVLKRYILASRYHLPIILETDAMAEYLALRPGQIVRITRPSPSGGTTVLYRCCMRA
jgi:DNA-directed RNA polymerase subunit H (RpoH/RPB5)